MAEHFDLPFLDWSQRMPKVLISTSSFARFDKRPLELLQDAGVTYALNPHGRRLTPAESEELMRDVDGIIAGTERLSGELLKGAGRLRAICRCGAGMDNVDLTAAAELGISVTNTPDAHVDAVAELTLAAMLNVLRHVPRADRELRAGEWYRPMGELLRQKVVGVIGLGRVGRRLVELLEPFEVRLVVSEIAPDADFAERHGITYAEMDSVLRQADILSLHLPYTPEFHHLIDERAMSLLKRGAVLVNTARGGLVDEGALYDALSSGRLSAAYLDVFEQEPYRGRLTTLPNVVLSPHIGSYAAECRIAMELEAARKMVHLLDGDPADE